MRDPFSSVPQVAPAELFTHLRDDDIQVVDVREPDEWELGHIDGILHLPLGHLPWRWRELDPEKKLVCVCRSGQRSNYAAALLRQQGIDAANMEGGMLAWKASGLPVTPPGIVESH